VYELNCFLLQELLDLVGQSAIMKPTELEQKKQEIKSQQAVSSNSHVLQ
jgi:hypothetical protein